MGGDSAGVAGYSISARGDPKVFINGDYMIGFTTSFRMGQLLRYKLEPSPCPKRMDLERHMSTTFIDEVRKCFSDNGVMKTDNGEESCGTFLVATKGRIFVVESDFQVGWNRVPYDAVGCGKDLALGVMHALHRQTHVLPQDIVMSALEGAEEFSAGVCGPFNIVTQG
jgi:ATP-dependent protease HslVU (ClpYQ) peptidase subunit